MALEGEKPTVGVDAVAAILRTTPSALRRAIKEPDWPMPPASPGPLRWTEGQIERLLWAPRAEDSAHGFASASLKFFLLTTPPESPESRSPAYVVGGAGPCALSTCEWDSNSLLDRIGLSAQGFDNSLAVGWVAELAEPFDIELEEFPEPSAFWAGRKVWRGVWDDFRNWLVTAA